MRKTGLAAAVAGAALAAGAASASAVSDATGDFLPSYAFAQTPDLDVTFFSVQFDDPSDTFILNARMAGKIDPSKPGLYVIGANTGTGTARPFAGIGAPNVIFNQALVIQKTGAGTVNVLGTPRTFTATISGDSITALIPLAFLPSTGFAPIRYGFNIWPRAGLGSNSQISDFAPNNATITAAPEPAVWGLMIAGFGLAGGALRRRRAAAGPA